MEGLIKSLVSKKIKVTEILKIIVTEIRPTILGSDKAAINRFSFFIETLENNPETALYIGKGIGELLEKKDLISLFTESGIYNHQSFFKTITQKIYHVILPPIVDESEIKSDFNEIFNRKSDFQWVKIIPNELWMRLFNVLQNHQEFNVKNNIWHTVQILSHRIIGISISAELTEKYKELEDPNSVFLNLQHKVNTLKIQEISSENDYLELISCLNQCDKKVLQMRKAQHQIGAGLTLTFNLQRLHQHLARLRILVNLIFAKSVEIQNKTASVFLKKLVEFENEKHSLRGQISNNLEVLAFQITEHTGRTGEHYITTDAEGYAEMKKSAMKGGAVVGLLNITKIAIHKLHLSQFGEAFLYSMNYSLGFIGIHFLHGTLATKQPAMTASKLAASLDNKDENPEESLQNLAKLIIDTFRSQFIAFVGNLVVAFPVAFLLSMLIFFISGDYFVSETKAWKLVKDINPIKSLSLFHAAIAGVYLFLAGVISGYYDNSVIFNKVPQRLKAHPVLKKIISAHTLQKLAHYIEHNSGVIIGNFILGILLGITGTVGVIFGLPIDIRHITFAAGNFGLAIATLGTKISLNTALTSTIGILLIGLVNFTVSFGLALLLATKSRRVSFSNTKQLLWMVFKKFLKSPKQFFVIKK
jgi:site-specific recombinase